MFEKNNITFVLIYALIPLYTIAIWLIGFGSSRLCLRNPSSNEPHDVERPLRRRRRATEEEEEEEAERYEKSHCGRSVAS